MAETILEGKQQRDCSWLGRKLRAFKGFKQNTETVQYQIVF